MDLVLSALFVFAGPVHAAPSIAKSITVVSPNGGEGWTQGTEQVITWTYTGKPGAKVKIEGLRDGKSVKFEIEVAEEERGGKPESESLQSFLESWQGYTDAFQNELRRLDSERDPLMRQALKGLTLNSRLRRI